MKRILAVFLSVLLCMSSVSFTALAAPIQQTLATWDYTVAPTQANVPATGGISSSGAELTNSKNLKPTFSSSSLSLVDWSNGQDTKYWQVSFSTVGYSNVSITTKTRSSSTGPRDFKAIYSINAGANWSDVPNSAYSVTTTTLTAFMPTIVLPENANNCIQVLIRFIMTSNNSSSSTTVLTVATTGTSNINNILISGLYDDSMPTPTPSPTPEFTPIPSATATPTLMPSVSSTPTMTGTPTPIPAPAVADVVASVPGGTVLKGSQISLSCITQGATIKYSIDAGITWLDYSIPLFVDQFPTSIMTYATKIGLTDGNKVNYNFTEKIEGQYNLYYGQLHSHTTVSDGIGTVSEAFTNAKNVAKLDFLAVTDHSNSLSGTGTINDGSQSTEWLASRKTADDLTTNTFVAIYGYEMTYSNGTGHINTFNTAGFETRESAIYKTATGLKAYYDALKTAPQSISQFNHPGTTFGDFNDFSLYDPVIDNKFSMIEVGNGEGPVHGSGYFPSYEYYTRALDKGWHVAPTNNQDNHKGMWGNSNSARDVVLATTLTRDSIYDAMKSRRMYSTEDADFRMQYSLNGEVMGSILTQKPSRVDIKLDLEEPDNEPIGTVSVIVNGGKVLDSKTFTTSKETVAFTLDPSYSYYYIKITQPDKDIIVSAPVWIGGVDKAGISKISTTSTMPMKGDPFKIKTELYNNETTSMSITSLEYSLDGRVINTAPALGDIPPSTISNYEFDFSSVMTGKYDITCRLVANINGVEKIFNDVLKVTIADPKMVSKIVIDASHMNDYVSGYYANNYFNLQSLAVSQGMAVDVVTDKLTDDRLKNAQTLVVTAPAKKTGAKNGVSYSPSAFTPDELASIKKFADNGGSLIACGTADYGDGIDVYQSSTQINALLQAVGATTKINNDEVIDNTNNVSATAYRLVLEKS